MIFDKIVEIISEQLEVDADLIKSTSYLAEDLGADSLDMVDLAMSIEDEYGVEMPEDLENIKTVGDLVEFIEEKI